MQVVRFRSAMAHADAVKAAEARLSAFRKVPGLIQKYYMDEGDGWYRGIYIWESRAAMLAYRESDLFNSIPAAYEVAGAPEVDILKIMFTIR